MLLKIELELSGAAMTDAGAREIGRMLSTIPARLEAEGMWEELSMPLRDINGNRVGTAWTEEES